VQDNIQSGQRSGQTNHARMVDHTDALIAYLDLDFNFIDLNCAYAQGCGKSREELIGKNHFDFFPNDENLEIFKMVRTSGQKVEYHAKPFIFPDQPEKSVTYWDWILKPVKEADGKTSGLVLTLREVTEQYKIWKQSRKSAIKLMLLMGLTIFASDFLIMLVFKLFDDTRSIDFMMLDPFILACLLLPIIYFFYLHPLITSVANTKQTKRSLLQSFNKLESERSRLFSILDELPANSPLPSTCSGLTIRLCMPTAILKNTSGLNRKHPVIKSCMAKTHHAVSVMLLMCWAAVWPGNRKKYTQTVRFINFIIIPLPILTVPI